MTPPTPTPTPTQNAATITRPERSSQRVSRKSPLAWLPWALLGALALLLALVLLAVNAIDDDGAEGPADDRLGQLSSDGSGEGSADAEADAPKIDLKALSAGAVVGGGAVAVAPVGDVKGAGKLADARGAAGTVLFAEGSAQIDASGAEVVAAAAKSLKDAGVTAVQVVGHTDVIAGDPVNDTLSKERAENVAAALRKQLPGVDVSVAAKGQDEPIASNEDETGRQLNRRAVITATG